MDFTSLLDPVESDQPSGVELRNDPRFHAIERLIEPAARSNRLNDDGSVNLSAPDVDWQQVLDDSAALAAEGRDLRLLTKVVRAANRLEGFGGLSEALELLTGTIDQYWDSLHPGLRDRPDAKSATLPRANAVRQLENDDNGLLGDLKYSVLLEPRGIGPVVGAQLAAASLSDFDVLNNAASGLSEAERAEIVDRHAHEKNRVVAACRAMAAEEADKAEALLDGIKSVEVASAKLVNAFNDSAGFGSEPGIALNELHEFLGQMRITVEAAIADAGGDNPAVDAETPAADAAHGGGGGASVGPTSINSRADVELALEKVIAFYERTEPASPIPFFVQRIKKMVPMDFVALMEEVAPSGIKEFRSVAGLEDPATSRRRARSARDDNSDN